MGFGFAARVHQNDFDVAAEFPEDLAASAAGMVVGAGEAAALEVGAPDNVTALLVRVQR